MKVIVDTNLLIGYLLASNAERTVTTVLQSCLRGPIRLIVPQRLLDELVQTVQKDPYLHERIKPAEVAMLAEQLSLVGETPLPLQPEPSYSRDANEDYLVVNGLVEKVDFLITGDPELLVLEQIENLRIVTPLQFLSVLKDEGLL